MIIITIFSLLLIYSFPFLKTSINTILFRRICAISFIYASVLSFNTFYIQSIGSGVGLYSGLFEINILSLFISFFILIISSIILLVWPDLTSHVKFTKNKNLEEEYCLIVLFSLLGALFLVNSSDLLSMYLSIELQSFGLYILASLYKDKLSATSAGLKYFLLGGLSSCIILLGCGLIYSYTGLTNLESIYNFISVYYCEEQISNWKGLFSLDLSTIFNHSTLQETGLNSHLSDTLVLSKDGHQWQGIGVGLGLIFIFSGFLFKIAASPFHNWAPAWRFRTTLRWVKLSNSGDTLKLMIPNYLRKIISGWINYSCKVTSHKMKETEMGYRGSKSVLIINTVKEQRVDGSWSLLKSNRTTIIKNKFLRCTLMGCESSYRIKILSNQLKKFYFSTFTNQALKNEAGTEILANNLLDPWFITGFTDAEGSFQVSFRYDKKYKTKWRISPCFQIKLHVKDIALLNKFKKTLGVGTITTDSSNSACYNVWSVKDLQIIVDHFVKYPLITWKLCDFLLFKQCFEIIMKGEHLTEKGLLEIISLKSSLNLVVWISSFK